MTCPKCGFFNPAGETVCQLCGSALSQSFSQVAAPAAQDVRESVPETANRAPDPALPGESIARSESGRIICPQCGFENDPELDYCEKCFASLKAPVNKVPAWPTN